MVRPATDSAILELSLLIEQHASQAFKAAITNLPEETFYTFGVHISGDMNSILPAGNTEQSFERTLKTSDRYYEDDTHQWLYHRWTRHEWGQYECLEPETLSEVTHEWLAKSGWAFSSLLDEDEDQIEAIELAIFLAMVRAMSKIGFNNQNIVKFAAVSDYDSYIVRSWKQLNSSENWLCLKDVTETLILPNNPDQDEIMAVLEGTL